MNPDARSLLRGLAKFVAVVAASVLAGVALGLGLSEVSGDDGTPIASLNPPGTATGTTAAADASGESRAKATAGTSGPAGASDAKGAAKPRYRVLSATIEPATSASGMQRRRARVTVRLRATAGSEPLTLDTPTLVAGNERQPVDPNAADAAGALLKEIPAGDSATGELRFETAGALTQRMTTFKAPRLIVGPTSLRLQIKTRL